MNTWHFDFFFLKVFLHTIYIHIHVSKYLCKNYFVNNNSIKIYNQIMWGIYINNKWQKYINILYNNMWISIIYITSMWILITIQKKYSEIKRENKYSEMKRKGWKNNTLFVIHLFFFFFNAKRWQKRLVCAKFIGTMYSYGMFKDGRKWALNTNSQTTPILRRAWKEQL